MTVIEVQITYWMMRHILRSLSMKKDLTSKREFLDLISGQKVCGLRMEFLTKIPCFFY